MLYEQPLIGIRAKITSFIFYNDEKIWRKNWMGATTAKCISIFFVEPSLALNPDAFWLRENQRVTKSFGYFPQEYLCNGK